MSNLARTTEPKYFPCAELGDNRINVVECYKSRKYNINIRDLVVAITSSQCYVLKYSVH